MGTGLSYYLQPMGTELGNLSKEQLIELIVRQDKSALEMDAALSKKDGQLSRSEAMIAQMEDMINRLRRLHYGTKSERFLAENMVIANQLDLPFAELAAKTGHADSEKTVKETITYTRAKNQGHKGRNRLPEDMPVHEVVIEPAMPVEGMVKIGEERTEILELAPARFFKLVWIRNKYALPDGQGILIGDMPSRPIEKCLAGNALLSSILINKYVDHLPLYRQQQIFKRAGIQIAPSTIDGWVAKLGALLEPLYEAMADVVRLDGYLQVDETPTRVLDKSKKGKCHLGYYWVYHAPPKRMVVFDYQRGRGKQGPQKMLDNYKGYLQTDGYSVYHAYAEKEEIVHLACWAHARRYFEQSRDQDRERAEYALGQIQQLYAIEREAKEWSTGHRKTIRLEKSLPIINGLGKWIARENKHVLPKSPIGKAFNYAVNSWDSLLNYLYNGELLIDNNLIEPRSAHEYPLKRITPRVKYHPAQCART